MRERKYQPEFWHLLAAEPGIENSFRRWNVIVISLLAFLLLGVFVAGLGSLALYGSSTASSVPSHATQHAAHRG